VRFNTVAGEVMVEDVERVNLHREVNWEVEAGVVKWEPCR